MNFNEKLKKSWDLRDQIKAYGDKIIYDQNCPHKELKDDWLKYVAVHDSVFLCLESIGEFNNDCSTIQTVGILQTIYLLQDCMQALANWYSVDYKHNNVIRELRNNMIGHPIERRHNQCSFSVNVRTKALSKYSPSLNNRVSKADIYNLFHVVDVSLDNFIVLAESICEKIK